MNGGTITTAAGVTTFTRRTRPRSSGLALGFESDDGQERWIFPQDQTVRQDHAEAAQGRGQDDHPRRIRCSNPPEPTPGRSCWKDLPQRRQHLVAAAPKAARKAVVVNPAGGRWTAAVDEAAAFAVRAGLDRRASPAGADAGPDATRRVRRRRHRDPRPDGGAPPGPEQRRPCLRTAASPVDGNDGELFTELLGHIMQAATGRPPRTVRALWGWA